MRCTEIQARLFEREENERDRRHLDDCPECAAFAAAIPSIDVKEPEFDASLQAIFSVSPQSACEQAEEQLPEWLDGELEAVQGELVGGHLQHCDRCDELVSILRRAEGELPSLIAAENDESFVASVVAATPFADPQPSWGQRFDRWVAALVRRPRIAWEGAYLATACLALLIMIPGSPFADASVRALEWTQGAQMERPFVALGEQLTSGGQEANVWMRRARIESGIVVESAKRDLGTLWTRLASSPTTSQTPEEGRGNGEIK